MKKIIPKILTLCIALMLSTSLMAQMTLEFNTNLSAGTMIEIRLIGTANVTIDWDDGNSQSYNPDGTSINHTYGSDGIYTVSISGGSLTQFGNSNSANIGADKMTKVTSFGSYALTSLYTAFYGTTNLSEVPATLPSTVTNLRHAFAETGQASITNLDNWDVSNVTDMSFMFYKTTAFNQNINNWKRSGSSLASVTDMSYMFSETTAFNQDIDSWDVRGVTSMRGMFNYAAAFNQDIGSWVPSSVTTMEDMFKYAAAFNRDIDSWDVSSVTTMENMFSNTTVFNQDLNSWVPSSVLIMKQMFSYTTAFNGNIADWGVSSVTDMSGMFSSAVAFNQDIGSWDVSSVTSIVSMFAYTTAFNQDIGSWVFSSSLTSMQSMFFNAAAFNQDLSSWDVSSVTDMSSMFSGTTAFNGNIRGWDVSSVIDMSGMFSSAVAFNQDIGSWDVSSVTSIVSMFAYTTAFNQDIGSWVFSSSLTSMQRLFFNAAAFNQDLSSWDVSSVTDMSSMFSGTTAFNGNIDGWDVSSVTTMQAMFKDATAFNQDLNNWERTGSPGSSLANVTNMYDMFNTATAFNGNIGSWNVSSVIYMNQMFPLATAFNQDIGSWNVSSVTSMKYMFYTVTLSTANYDALLIGWNALSLQPNVTFGGGNSRYSHGAAATARTNMTNPIVDGGDNWTITDGGMVLTWSGSTNADWNTGANWDSGVVPTPGDNVTIPNVANDPVIGTTGTGDCNDITIASGATLTINSGGSLITAGEITNNGTINVKRTISDGQWHLISAPNNNTTANTFLNEYLQTWDEASATWAYITEPTTALTEVKGYSLWGIAKSTSYTFSGTPNTGNQSITLTAGGSGDYTGANLLGNPYPSSIDWSGLDDTWGAVYYWDGSAYAAWNNGASMNSGVQYIPPMQGFFIVTGSSGTFSLENSNRTHDGATAFFKSEKEFPNNSIMLVANGNSFTDELFISFNEESTEDFDLQYDAYKFLSSTDGIAQIYSYTSNNKLSIDIRPATNIIQLGFQNNTNGNYSIDINEMDGFTSVSIEDTKNNTLHSFTDGAYNFDYSITDAKTRFKLHLQATGTNELQNDLFNVYTNNNTIYVKSENQIINGHVKVLDVTGRVIAQQNINNSNIVSIPANFKTGMYIVVVETEVGISSNKVIIN